MSWDDPLKIVVCCRHPDILATLVWVIRERTPHEVYTCSHWVELQKLLTGQSKDLVLIGSGFNHDDESRMIGLACQYLPPERVVLHYGGGSGLLFSEIRKALGCDASSSTRKEMPDGRIH